MFEDKTLVCEDCSNEFIFTAGEQEFFQAKGYTTEPKRCKDCRRKRREERGDRREMYPVVCSGCGKDTEVPFKPRGDRPVYCQQCYYERK
jgi:CxxC-x17-CxxC domain-containing protein